MSGTISTTITNTYTLSVNPTTVTKTGAVEVTSNEEDAIYGPSSAWSLNNHGTVSASGGYGVDLRAGGTITNAGGALISGGGFAVYYGRGSDGQRLYHYYGAGVVIHGAAGTVVNSGTIEDSATNFYGGYTGAGILLNDGGTVTNTTGGVIGLSNPGAGFRGIESYGTAAVSVTNAGTIIGVNLVDGSVTNSAGGTIEGVAIGTGESASFGTGMVMNAGTMEGVDLGGGYVGNAAGGVMSSSYGVSIGPGGGTVVNGGTITGKNEAYSNGKFFYIGAGVDLTGGGSVTNSAGGMISGGGPAAAGIQAGGTGVVISGGAGTVMNAGTISGGTDAVELASGYANLVEVDPGAVFNGIVDGGNPIGGPVASTLELANGFGTLVGLNTQFVDFSDIIVGGGAWQISGNGTIDVGQTLTDYGAASYSGNLSVAGEIALADGSFTADGLTIAAGAVVSGYGTIGDASSPLTVAAGGTLAAGSGGDTIDVANADIAGALDGSAINFDAGRSTLEKGVHGTVGTIELSGSAALSLGLGLGGTVFHGTFVDNATNGITQFLPHNNNVTLAGPVRFTENAGKDEIVGTASLNLAGPSYLTGDVEVENSETLLDSGRMDQNGFLNLNSSASVRVTATGTWEIQSSYGIGLGSGASGSVTNIGTFEKAGGTGTSVITADFVNYGTIIASVGTLDFAGGFTNHGTIIQNGGTVIFGPAASPALFNQYAAGMEPAGMASTVAAGAPETPPPATLAPPHAA